MKTTKTEIIRIERWALPVNIIILWHWANKCVHQSAESVTHNELNAHPVYNLWCILYVQQTDKSHQTKRSEDMELRVAPIISYTHGWSSCSFGIPCWWNIYFPPQLTGWTTEDYVIKRLFYPCCSGWVASQDSYKQQESNIIARAIKPQLKSQGHIYVKWTVCRSTLMYLGGKNILDKMM